MKKQRRKFRRTFRKRRKQLNLRFRSLRRGGKKSIHKVAVAKMAATKLHKNAQKKKKEAQKKKKEAQKKKKEAAVATTEAVAAKVVAQNKAIHAPTSAAARKAANKAANKAEIAKKKAKKAQNDAAKTAIVAYKAKTKADKAKKKVSKKSPLQITNQTIKAAKHNPTPPKDSFKVGDKVILQGLQGRYDLNGKEGTIKSKRKTTGRYTIQLDVKVGAGGVGARCKTGSDCKSYHCKGGQCFPGQTEIDIKPENMKLPRAASPPPPPLPPKAPCNPFTITKVPCSTLRKQFLADVKLCHEDQSAGRHATKAFQTLQKNYNTQMKWCAKTKQKGTRPVPQDKDEWDCLQKTNAKWDEKTKKCVAENKPPVPGVSIKPSHILSPRKPTQLSDFGHPHTLSQKKHNAFAKAKVVGFSSKKLNQMRLNKETEAAALAKEQAEIAMSKKNLHEKCTRNKDCKSNVCSIILDICSTKEAEKIAINKQQQRAIKKAVNASKNVEHKTALKDGECRFGRGDCDDEETCVAGKCEKTPPAFKGEHKKVATAPKTGTSKIVLTNAAQEEVEKQFAAPPDSKGNRIVILKITGEQLGPSGAGQSVVRGSGGLNASVAVAATDDAIRR